MRVGSLACCDVQASQSMMVYFVHMQHAMQNKHSRTLEFFFSFSFHHFIYYNCKLQWWWWHEYGRLGTRTHSLTWTVDTQNILVLDWKLWMAPEVDSTFFVRSQVYSGPEFYSDKTNERYKHTHRDANWKRKKRRRKNIVCCRRSFSFATKCEETERERQNKRIG